MCPSRYAALPASRNAERAAKLGKLGMWHNYVPQASNTAKLRCGGRGAGRAAGLAARTSRPAACLLPARPHHLIISMPHHTAALAPPAPPCASSSDKFTGTVCEVVSGDCLMVKDKASGALWAQGAGGRSRGVVASACGCCCGCCCRGLLG